MPTRDERMPSNHSSKYHLRGPGVTCFTSLQRQVSLCPLGGDENPGIHRSLFYKVNSETLEPLRQLGIWSMCVAFSNTDNQFLDASWEAQQFHPILTRPGPS